jgi:hypothetical protein
VEAGNEIHHAYDGGSEVVDGYERLRARALCGDVEGWRLGLGVLQHRGVAGWLRVRTATAPARPAPSRSALPLAGDADAELVELLTSMALTVLARG